MKAFAALVLIVVFTNSLPASGALFTQRVLYIGHRTMEFEPFLKTNFIRVECVSRDGFKPEQARDFDVVLLDWPQSDESRTTRKEEAPLGKREDWNKPTVLLGSAGLNLAVAWKVKGGSGCTCLAPVALNLRDHPVFKSPISIDITATTNIPTPEQFESVIKSPTIPVLPLVDGIKQYQTVIEDYKRGWATHYYGFTNIPDVEVFSGGINAQTPASVAFWRQGNLLHFGFEQSPIQLNGTGRAMLLNGIVYISRFTEDRPIDISPSVFGPDRVAVSRSRAASYMMKFPQEITNIFSATALQAVDWHDAEALAAWFKTAFPWLHPNQEMLLEIDMEAKLLGTTFDSPEFLPKSIAALHEDKTRTTAAILLARYVHEPLGSDATPKAWDQWWHDNAPYVFFSEVGCYRWYVDPLAKKRGIPTKQFVGPARQDTHVTH